MDKYQVSLTCVFVASVLVEGFCVVDESMLTGESVSVSKKPFDAAANDEFEFRQTGSLLYSGTRLLATGGGINSSGTHIFVSLGTSDAMMMDDPRSELLFFLKK